MLSIIWTINIISKYFIYDLTVPFNFMLFIAFSDTETPASRRDIKISYFTLFKMNSAVDKARIRLRKGMYGEN